MSATVCIQLACSSRSCHVNVHRGEEPRHDSRNLTLLHTLYMYIALYYVNHTNMVIVSTLLTASCTVQCCSCYKACKIVYDLTLRIGL